MNTELRNLWAGQLELPDCGRAGRVAHGVRGVLTLMEDHTASETTPTHLWVVTRRGAVMCFRWKIRVHLKTGKYWFLWCQEDPELAKRPLQVPDYIEVTSRERQALHLPVTPGPDEPF